jgi:hypothetical protein
MRTWNHLLWPCVASLALMAAGCKPGTNGGTDGGADLGGGNDLAQPPRPTIGPLVFTEITGQALIGGVPTDVRLLSPLLTFRDVNTPVVPPDYSEGLIGCTGDHYDTTTNDLPGASANGGAVRITGFREVTPLTGGGPYNEINCQLSGGSYVCGYGPVTGGNLGPDTSTTPLLAATQDPLQAGDRITFMGAGNGNFGTFPVTGSPNSTAPVALDTISADLSGLTYPPNQDTVINITCGGTGGCSGVAAVNIDVSRNAPDNVTGPSQTFGHITCAAFLLQNSTTVTISRQAINAMRGCDSAGNNCDTNLQSVRTVLVRLSAPLSAQDSNQNSITNIVAGQGIFAARSLQ